MAISFNFCFLNLFKHKFIKPEKIQFLPKYTPIFVLPFQLLKLLVSGFLKILCPQNHEGWLVGVRDGKNKIPSITDYIWMGSHQEFRPIL